MSLNLASILETSTRFFPHETALIHGSRRISFREFRTQVTVFAAHLRRQGIDPGDRVAILLPNSMSFTIAYFAILHAGAVVVPLSYLSVAREITYTLNDSDAVALIAFEGYSKEARTGFKEAGGCRTLLITNENDGPLTLAEAPDPDARLDLHQTNADDTAVILYTSGTTGKPKGAELTHFNLYSNAQFSCERIFWIPGEKTEFLSPGHVALAVLPLFHSFGQTCIQNAAIFGGAAVSYMDRFDAEETLGVMARDRVTLFAGVPTMYFQLLEVKDHRRHDLSRLRYCVSGGAAMPVEVMREFDERYGVNILEGYGLSETSPVSTFNVLWRAKRPGSIGQAIFGVDVRVFDANDLELPPGEIGEIVIRGPNVMKGYYNRPEATAEALRDGWLRTGDLGRVDEDGYFYIVDRKKDMIIRGGFNVYPREVEEVLYAHPAVQEAAVIGVPDREYGEEVKAYVSLKAESSALAEDITVFCRGELGAHKYPRMIEILDELPKGPTGKILRKELRRL